MIQRLILLLFITTATTATAQRTAQVRWDYTPATVRDYLLGEPGWKALNTGPKGQYYVVDFMTTGARPMLAAYLFAGDSLAIVILKHYGILPLPATWEKVEVGYLDRANNLWILREYDGPYERYVIRKME